MGYYEILFSGSAAALASTQIDTALTESSGGIGIDSSTLQQGDLIVGDSNGELSRFAHGSNLEILRVNEQGTGILWGDDASAAIDVIQSGNAGNTGVIDNGLDPSSVQVDILTGSAANANVVKVVSGDGAFDLADSNPLNKTNNAGVVTSVSASSNATSYGLTLISDQQGTAGPITAAGTITLGGAFTNIPTSALTAGLDRIFIGKNDITGVCALGTSRLFLNNINYGGSSTTGIGFATGANRSLANGLGANTLTLGDGTSTIKIPGNLNVAGDTKFITAGVLRIKDDTFLVNDSDTPAVGDGGFIVAQNGASNDNVSFRFDESNKSGTPATGTYKGQFGFPLKNTIPILEGAVGISQKIQVIKDHTSDPSNTGEYPDAPLYGGTLGHGHLWINKSTSKAFIYV
jgi:hypothetical protein